MQLGTQGPVSDLTPEPPYNETSPYLHSPKTPFETWETTTSRVHGSELRSYKCTPLTHRTRTDKLSRRSSSSSFPIPDDDPTDLDTTYYSVDRGEASTSGRGVPPKRRTDETGKRQ